MSESKKGTPFRTVELADCKEGSIVSHSIVKSEKGNITFFAFAKGEQLSPHSAPFDAYLQVMAGRAEIGIADETHDMSTGQAVILPANVPHSVKASEDMKMLLVMIKEQPSNS